MIQREIQIFMKIPDIAQPFGIYTSSYDAGRVGDSGVTVFKFNRPEEYENNNLRIIMKVGYNDPTAIDLGYSNELTLTTSLTAATSFVMQVAFMNESGDIITMSNKLTFYLTSSITPDSPTLIPDYLQELLQFAVSSKISQMKIIETVDPDDATKITYKLVAFNHSGDQISEVELPINSFPDATSVKYDNSTSGLKSKFVQGAIDEIDQKLSSELSEVGYFSIAPVGIGVTSKFAINFKYPFDKSIVDGYWGLLVDNEIVTGSIKSLDDLTYVDATQIFSEDLSNLSIGIYSDAEGTNKMFEFKTFDLKSLNFDTKYKFGRLELK